MDYKPKHNDMEMWLICEAIGADRDLIDKMKHNSNGSYSVEFKVGGVELDFSNVAKSLNASIDEMVTERAKELLDKKYNSLVGEIYDIQERLEEQKKTFFKMDIVKAKAEIIFEGVGTETDFKQMRDNLYDYYPEFVNDINREEHNEEPYDDNRKTYTCHFYGTWTSDDEDDFIRLIHHAEALYDETTFEYVHVEVCLNGKWYGR